MTIALATALSNRVTVTLTISSSSSNGYIISPSDPAISGVYKAGSTNLNVSISTGISLWPSAAGIYGLTSGLKVTGFSAGDRITITNNGAIFGRGGSGGASSAGGDGSPAVLLENNVTFTNSSYGSIYGGGGGGGGCSASGSVGGGGGAGAGNGAGSSPGSGASTLGGTGGSGFTGSGGGGGWSTSNSIALGVSLISSTNGTYTATAPGGGQGGAGGGQISVVGSNPINAYSGSGQVTNTAGGNAGVNTYAYGQVLMCGGGGGWGAAGGAAYASSGTAYAGGSAGKAINPNGYVLTLTNNGVIYGATS